REPLEKGVDPLDFPCKCARVAEIPVRKILVIHLRHQAQALRHKVAGTAVQLECSALGPKTLDVGVAGRGLEQKIVKKITVHVELGDMSPLVVLRLYIVAVSMRVGKRVVD